MATFGYFDRITDRVNLRLLQTSRVVVVGVGTVGSQIARELANSGVGHLLLIDDDVLELSNLLRHILPKAFIGLNKAEAVANYLAEEVPGLHAEAVPRKIDASMTDAEIDRLLQDADLIVAATDDREAQRRIARRALALDVLAIFPALYADSGGEVIVQSSPQLPCFFCWDGYRGRVRQARGVAAREPARPQHLPKRCS